MTSHFAFNAPYEYFASFCGNSSIGRASASQAEGRGFDSRFPLHRAVSSVGLERLPYKQEAGGSNPSPPTFVDFAPRAAVLAALVR